MSKEKKSKFTFTNILMMLLLLGTIGVMGLMYTVYRDIARTPETTAQNQQQQAEQQQASRPIEMLTPDGSPVQPPARNLSLPNTPQAASAPSYPPVSEGLDTESLTAGTAPKKAKKAKPAETESADSGEIQLTPTARSESIPGERMLEPSPTPPREKRPEPNNSKQRSGGGDAIDELF